MAVVYFTSNASTGAGSLSEAVQSAQPGDVVRPDETVFERGATIEIALASTLTIDKNLTLDGGPFRVALNGGSVVRCAFVASGATVAFSGFDFLGGATSSSGGGIYVEASASLVLTRCRVAGCSAGSGGGGIYSRGGVALNDCIVTGCVAQTANGGGISATGALVLDGSTVVGNSTGASGADVRATATLVASNSILGDVSTGSATAPDYLGCVVGVASSEIGFVAPPPDDLAPETWTPNAWRDWDLRLLDDASPNPSPYRDAGDVDNMSRYDVQGNFRGRETDGATTCSPGAFETLQADLFWIGSEIDPTAPSDLKVADYDAEAKTLILSWTPNLADATGYDVQYSTSGTGWANLTGAAADATSRLCGGLGAARTYIYRIRAYNAVGATAWSTIAFTPSALDEATAETGTREVVSPSLLASNGWAASRFALRPGDAAPQLGQTLFVDGRVHFIDALSTSSTQTFGLTVGGGAVVAIDAASRVYFGELQIALGASFASTSQAQPRTSTRCGAWSRLDAALVADKPCDFGDGTYIANAQFYNVYVPNAATYGALKIATSTLGVIRLSGEYVCDSFSTSQNGALASQTIMVGDDGALVRARSFQFGGASAADYVESFFDRPVTLKLQGIASVSLPSTRRESWADDFLIDVTDATSATLTLSGQTVCGDAPNAAVELSGSAKIDEHGLDVASLTLAAGATLAVDGGKVCVAELTVADGATVAFSPVATDGTAGTDAIYVDAILSATTSATVGAATFAGCGYFATPTGTDLTSATFAEDVRVCDYDASLTSFLAAPGVSGVALAWTVANVDASVLLERQDANGWAVVETRAVGGSARVDGLAPGTTLFRAFDGAQFLTAQTLVQASHIRLDYDDSSVVALAPVYEVVLEIVLMSDYRNRGESPLLLARVADSATGDFIPKDAVASIVYSARRVETLYGSKRYVDVEGHVDREIPLDAYFDLPVADDPRWLASYPNDERGYNFRFEPDSTRFPVLPEPGDYEIVVEIRFRQGNPAPLVFRTRVV